MRYYAAANHYSSDTSFGFSNTWYVLAFTSRSARDRYVRDSPSLAATAITRSEVTSYVERKPAVFSGERYALTLAADSIDGCIGEVSVAYRDDPHYIADLH